MHSAVRTTDIFEDSTGLQLPIFARAMTRHLASEGIPAGLREHDTFARYVRIAENMRYPLNVLIEIADTVFAAAAESVDAKVIPHTWGLAPPFEHRGASYFFRNQALPKGFLLAAEVEFIPGLEPLGIDSLEGILIRDRVLQLPVATSQGPHRWFDGSANNFGRSPTALYLHDLDIFMTQT